MPSFRFAAIKLAHHFVPKKESSPQQHGLGGNHQQLGHALKTATDEGNKAQVDGSGAASPGLMGGLADIMRT
ncbi:hypothetical protein [Paraburkholderia phenoliruptrix]|uniref:hypothetical protein n=1 Tax=Paraburkholderia phenoliruptrix TaxID=252970 RepID=UPI002869C352|nr:hypothetical protein [Paraburkholderia phenoliruptrix]WMY08268.1 hypothetical protein P3F88_00360 [Paraburkholderia phenoliruptrix]